MLRAGIIGMRWLPGKAWACPGFAGSGFRATHRAAFGVSPLRASIPHAPDFACEIGGGDVEASTSPQDFAGLRSDAVRQPCRAGSYRLTAAPRRGFGLPAALIRWPKPRALSGRGGQLVPGTPR